MVVTTVTPEMQDQVTQLYVGYFGRAPDAIGFSYWVNALATGTYTQYEIAAGFGTTPEFEENYNGLTATQAVTKMYENILDRAPDPDGLQYWVDAIESGINTISSTVVNILNSVVSQGTTTADGNLLINKTTVGEYFAITLASNDTAIAATAYASVTSDPATVAPAEAQLATSTAHQYTLTANPDTFVGQSGYNTFNAPEVLVGTTLTNTLQNADSLTGSSTAGAINTLIAHVTGGTIKPNKLAKISNIQIQNDAVSTLDLTNSTGLNNVIVQNNLGVQTLSNVQLATTTYTLQNTGLGLTVTAAANVLDGATDTANLTLSGVTGLSALTIDSGFETLAITSSGNAENSVDVSSFTGGVITLAGATATNLGTLAGGQELDATLSTGVVTVTANATGGDTITAGSGNDILQGTAVNAIANSTINGGLGNDTILFNASSVTATDSLLVNVSSVEILSLSGGSGDNSITIGATAFAAGITTVTGSTGADTLTITSAPTTSLTFTGLAGTDTLNLTNTGTTTANVTVDRVEAINSTGNGSNAVTIGGTAQQAATTYSGGTGVDSLTISNTYTGGLTVTVTGVETVTGGAFANTINLGLSGTAQAVQLGNAATGNVVNATDNTAASSITGGTGNDQFTVVGQTNLSALATLVGGLGNDTILFNASSVTATDSAFAKVSAVEIISLGGSGAHSITIGATAFAAGITTVTGSTGADTLTITSAPTTSLTFTGQGGSDILNINASVVNPAITVIDIGTITDSSTSTSSVTAITIGGSNATVSTTFTGGVGTDTLTVASTVTSGVTVSVANVESITGGAGNDIVTITSTGTTTVNGGTGSNDLIVISASSNTVTVNASNIDFVNDTMANTSVNTVNFTAASKTTLTNVESIVGSSGNDTLTSTIGAGYTLNAGQTYNLAGGAGDDVLTFSSVTTSASVTIASAFTFYANAGDGADTITMGIWAGTSSTATQYNIVNGGAGADTVTFAIAPTGGVSGAETTVTNLLRENLTNFTVGDVSLTSADQVLSGFTAANVGSAGETIVTSRINLTGATFVTAANTNVSTTVDNGTGGTNYTAYTTVSVATAMANFQDSANIGSVIFVATNNITTSSFTAQAGITAAVTYITGTIGTSGNAVNQNAMIAVNDGTNTALFNYVEGATLDAGIQAGELTLVGVVQGKTGLTALNFS